MIAPLRIEGVVCAVNRAHRRIVLRDDSAAMLLELPRLDERLRPGARMLMDAAHCTLTRGEFGIAVGTAPVVDVDGAHAAISRSGSVYLNAGLQPFRLEWFNFINEIALHADYRGPGVARQAIPSSALWHRDSDSSGRSSICPGVRYAAYTGNAWTVLPDFQTLQPVATGVATNLDPNLTTRHDNAALVFEGFLQIAQPGVYTFFVESDDGSRLWVGDPETACAVSILGQGDVPTAAAFKQAPAAANNPQWVEVEGAARFVGHRDDCLDLEILDGNTPVPVTILDSGTMRESALLNRRVRVKGICQTTPALSSQRTTRVIAISTNDLEILETPHLANEDDTLTSAERIRGLQPAEARKHLPVRVCGVVTMASHWSLVLRDSSGGVFIEFSALNWFNQPRPGEVWEIIGTTDPGDFSPIVIAKRGTCLGYTALPEPVRPTWEQLMNGSVDAELVEIQGVVTEWTSSQMTLLTRDGKLTLLSKTDYRLPELPPEIQSANQLLGSIVRVRGVFAANWDLGTLRFRPGELYLGNATLCVDEPAPEDPFSLPTRHATDPLLFTSHVGALTRLKLSGQVLYASPGEYLVTDGTNGVRVLTPKPLPLKEGDLIEAVGFPQLGGRSPVLLEATARKIGTTPRPVPTMVSVETLPDPALDATLVRLEAMLLSDVTRQGERVLELQAGPNHFLARLRLRAESGPALLRGSRLQLTGVYSSAQVERAGNDLDAFELLLNQPADIVVLRQGPWWTVRHTAATIATLLAGLVVALLWIKMLRRTVAQRTAQLEQEIEERKTAEHRRAMEQERARVAQDLHDDLGAGLAQIGWIGGLARRQSTSHERSKEYLEEITSKSNEMVTALDEIVWAINPRHDSTRAVSGYFCDYAQDFLRPTSIACRFDVARDHPDIALNSSQRHQLFLAFKEALTNVVKHAHASEVWIRIAADDSGLSVAIEDNGRGLPPGATVAGGNGLANMSNRLEQMGGRCEIQPRPDGGTIVRFQVRLSP